MGRLRRILTSNLDGGWKWNGPKSTAFLAGWGVSAFKKFKNLFFIVSSTFMVLTYLLGLDIVKLMDKATNHHQIKKKKSLFYL